MKIGIFGESFLPIYDGVGRVMKAYAEELSKKGHEVYVITPQYDTGYKGNLGYEILDYTSIRFYSGLPYRIGFPRLDSHFKFAMKHLDLDIVHVHGPSFSGRLGLRIAKKNKIPIIGTFHTKFYDDILYITHSKLLARIGAKYTGKFYSKCTSTWAVSQGSAETLKSYGCKKDILVMPNGTDFRQLNENRLSEVANKYNIQNTFFDTSENENIKDKKFTLFFAGRLNWNKNIKRCLNATKILANQGIPVQFLLAGSGPHEKEVKDYIKKLEITDYVKMLGFVSDREELDCLYSLCDLFLFPSIYDNASLAIREAAMMKRPSLVIEGSCSAEKIIDMKNGLICKDTDQEVAQKLLTYYNLPLQDKKLIQSSAFLTIPEKWEDIVSEAEKIYFKLVEENNEKWGKKLK